MSNEQQMVFMHDNKVSTLSNEKCRPIGEISEMVDQIIFGKGIIPEQSRIDNLIPEETIHLYNPREVVLLSLKKGFLTSVCMYDKHAYKANGVWVEADTEIRDAAKDVIVSHGICPQCRRTNYPEYFPNG